MLADFAKAVIIQTYPQKFSVEHITNTSTKFDHLLN